MAKWDLFYRSESRDYGEGYFEEGPGENYGVRDTEIESPQGSKLELQKDHLQAEQQQSNNQHQRPASPPRAMTNAFTFAEMFVFSYGVAVFWNFTEHQEKDVLADLTFSEAETGISLVVGAQNEEDFETEEFHFEYNPETPRPRVFNDMITLRSGDHMIKLTMSHAIAQSTKLSVFEQRMADQMTEAQHVPKRLALTGKLGLKREEVVKILGALFKSRVDVNLCKSRRPLAESLLGLVFPLSSSAGQLLTVPQLPICLIFPTFFGIASQLCTPCTSVFENTLRYVSPELFFLSFFLDLR